MRKTRVIEEVYDDLDHETLADSTIQFSYNGDTWEIDLSASNRRLLQDVLRPFMKAGRKVEAVEEKPEPRKAPAKKAAARKPAKRKRNGEDKKIREWAVASGIEIGKTGRVPARVREQYEAATVAEAA